MSVVALETVSVAVIAVVKGVSPSAYGNDTGRKRFVIVLAYVLADPRLWSPKGTDRYCADC